jgi:tetratricopeptide (TPR) repeat protein
MTRRKKGPNPMRLLILFILAGAGAYFSIVVVPTTPPLFIPTNTPTTAPQSYVTNAESLAGQGKFSQAIQVYGQAVMSDPKNPGIYINLTRLLIYTGNYKDAKTNIETAIMLNQNNSVAEAMHGYILGNQGDYLAAEGSLDKAISLDPNNALAYAYYTEVLVMEINDQKNQLGALDKATQYSHKALDLNPNLMETHRARGVLLENTSNYEEAATEYSAAIAINPNIADLHLALGRNYRALQQLPKAIEEFNRANALNPFDPLANTYISRTYLQSGDYAKAIQYAAAAIKVSPNDPYLYGNLGVAFYGNKQYKEAIDALKLAVQGGIAADGSTIQGLPLDYNIRIMEYYYKYGLALARSGIAGSCGDALKISQMIQNVVPNDDTSVYNAQEMPKICQQLISGTSTPTKPAALGTQVPTSKP